MNIDTRTCSRVSRRIARSLVTNKDLDSSIAIMNADGSNKRIVFKAETNCTGNPAGPCKWSVTNGVAFGPNWSPDGEWIVFGFGSFLQGRRAGGAKITLIRRD